jgi:hypothetical protein
VAARQLAAEPHLDALPLSFIHRPAIFQAGIALFC